MYTVKFKTLLLVVLLSWLSACTEELTVEQRIQRADVFKGEAKYQAAMIELKKAINLDKTNAVARYELGRLHMLSGNGAGAEKEFRKALENGMEMKVLISDLGQSLLLQNKFDDILSGDVFEGLDGADTQSIKFILRGTAYFQKGEYVKSKHAFLKAIELDASSIDAYVGLTKIALHNGELGEARELIDAAKKIDKNNPEVKLNEAILYSHIGDSIQAKMILRDIVESNKSKLLTQNKYNAYLQLIFLQLQSGELASAESDANALANYLPNHPYPNYLQALVAYQSGKYSEAEKYLARAIKSLPSHGPSQFLLGATNFALGNYEQANEILMEYVHNYPTHIQGRKLLAATHIKLNQHKKALKTLDDGIKDSEDAELLMLAGTVAISSGDKKAGLEYYQRAGKVNPSNNLIREEIAKLYIEDGDFDNAVKELGQTKGSKGGYRSKYLLINAELQKGSVDKALNLVVGFLKQEPNSAELYALHGIVMLHMGESIKANNSFRYALKLDEKFSLAHVYLARLYLQENNVAAAEKHFDLLLQYYPTHLQAMLGKAQLSEIMGDTQAAVAWLLKAVEANPNNAMPYLVLGYYYFKSNQGELALDVAQKAYRLNAELSTGLLLARTYILLGKFNESIALYEQLIVRNDDKLFLYLELSNAYSKNNNDAKARQKIEFVLSIDESNIPAYVALVKLEIKLGNNDAALALAKKAQKIYPKKTVGYLLEADIYMSSGEYVLALPLYNKVNELSPNPRVFKKIAQIHLKQKNTKKAMAILIAAVDVFPDNVELLLALASLHQENGDVKASILYYEKVIEFSPSNVIALNNLAYMYLSIEPNKALVYAELAYNSLPTNIAVLDTYAWILINNKQAEKGVKLLSTVYTEANIPEINYHYAYGLSVIGRNAESLKILQATLDEFASFTERGKAEALYEKLSN